MRNPHGYATVVGDLRRGHPGIVDNGVRFTESEIDTYLCEHCNRVVHVPAAAAPDTMGGFCRQCMGLICPKCVAKRTCTPWEQAMEKMEARQRLRDAMV